MSGKISVRINNSENMTFATQWSEDPKFVPPYQMASWYSSWEACHGTKNEKFIQLELYSAGILIGVVPLSVRKRYGARICSIRDGRMSNIAGGVFGLHPQHEPHEICSAVLRFFEESAEGIDIVYFQKLADSFLGQPNPLLDRKIAKKHPNSIYRGRITPDFENWEKARITSRNRKLHRRRMRQLETAIGPASIKRVESEAVLDEALAAFNRQRLEAHRDGRVPHVFADRHSIEALKALAIKGFEAADGFKLYVLNAGNKICAVNGVLVSGEYHSGFIVSHDAAFRKYGPGKILQLGVFRDLAERGATWFDLGLGSQPYKSEWADIEPLYDMIVPLTFRGQAAATGFRIKNALLTALKNSDIGLELSKRLRFLVTRLD